MGFQYVTRPLRLMSGRSSGQAIVTAAHEYIVARERLVIISGKRP